MEGLVLRTLWCYISNETAGKFEIYHPWLIGWVKGFRYHRWLSEVHVQLNLAISIPAISKLSWFPFVWPSLGYFETPLFRTYFHIPWNFKIVGFNVIILLTAQCPVVGSLLKYDKAPFFSSASKLHIASNHETPTYLTWRIHSNVREALHSQN